MSQISITDPSSELAVLAKLFPVKHKKPATVVEVLAETIDVKADSPELLDLLSAVGRRLQSLRAFAQDLSAEEVPDSLRRQIIEATNSFSRLLGPSVSHTQWEEARLTYLPERHIAALEWFGQTAKKYRPLRVVSESERISMYERITQAESQIQSDGNLQNWERMFLVEGLSRLRFTLRHFSYFGVESAIAELLLVEHQARNLRNQIEADTLNERSVSSVLQVLNVIALMGALYILPNEVLGASKEYIGWFNKPLIAISKESPERDRQRLLGPPVALIEPRKDAE